MAYADLTVPRRQEFTLIAHGGGATDHRVLGV
jgi:hypothetical protein